MLKLWKDITHDKTGKYVAKDVFKAVAFATGLLICVGAAICSAYGVQVSTEPAVLLLLLSFGLQASKGVESYYQRKSTLAYTVTGSDEPVTSENS